MMVDTMNEQKPPHGVEWTRVWGRCGFTWNPIKGCKQGCAWRMPDGSIANCYAEDVANRLAQAAYPQGFEHHYYKPSILDEPLRLKKPAGIFVGSMADVFGWWVPEEQIRQVLDVCRRAHWHVFFFLTKNPKRLREFSPFPANCWVGASVPPSIMWNKELSRPQQTKLLLTTLDALMEIEAPVKWLSIEPLSWDLSEYLVDAPLDWAVIGAASNGRTLYQPRPKWVASALDVLDAKSVPCFMKRNLRPSLGVAFAEWREEFPKEMMLRKWRGAE